MGYLKVTFLTSIKPLTFVTDTVPVSFSIFSSSIKNILCAAEIPRCISLLTLASCFSGRSNIIIDEISTTKSPELMLSIIEGIDTTHKITAIALAASI